MSTPVYQIGKTLHIGIGNRAQDTAPLPFVEISEQPSVRIAREL